MKNTVKPASLRIGNTILICGMRNEKKPTFRLRNLNIRRLTEQETPKVGSVKHFQTSKSSSDPASIIV